MKILVHQACIVARGKGAGCQGTSRVEALDPTRVPRPLRFSFDQVLA
jgi:hypothetical protein